MWRDLALAAVIALIVWLVIVVADSRIVERRAPSMQLADALERKWTIEAALPPEIEIFGDASPSNSHSHSKSFQLPRRWRRRIERHLEAGGQVELDSCGHDFVIHLRAGESI